MKEINEGSFTEIEHFEHNEQCNIVLFPLENNNHNWYLVY